MGHREALNLAEDSFGISPIKPPAAYELVVDQIRRALALGRFNPGDMLPSERGLAQQLGVSRTVVREAIRVLEGEGLLEVTRGATGGSRVLPAAGSQRLSADERRRQAQEIEQITEFRLANECAAARGAAMNRTDEESEHLQQLVRLQEELLDAAAATGDELERTRLTSRFIEVDNRFHLSVGAASHNHFLADAVETARINMRKPIGAIFATTTEDVNFQHREIADAISGHDPEAAGAAMGNHIRSTRTTLLEHLASNAARR